MNAYCGCHGVTLGLHVNHLEGADHTAKKPTTAYLRVRTLMPALQVWGWRDLGRQVYDLCHFIHLPPHFYMFSMRVTCASVSWALARCDDKLCLGMWAPDWPYIHWILQLKRIHTQCAPFLFAALHSERKQPRCTHLRALWDGRRTNAGPSPQWGYSENYGVFLSKHSQRFHLSPIEEMLWAMSVRGRERQLFILLYCWFRIKRG